MSEDDYEKDRKSNKNIRDYIKYFKTPLVAGVLLVIVLILLAITPVEYQPVVISLIKALTQVLLIGDFNVSME